MNPPKKFISIGAGNVASHLVKAFCSSNCQLVQVYSRSTASARELAEKYNSRSTTILDELDQEADFYIVSLPDNILPEILLKLKIQKGIVLHTAGSHGLEIFKNRFEQYGVFYPLQSITKNIMVDFSEIPILVEANNNQTLLEVKNIAECVSHKVSVTDSETRKWIHLAAVFANNFTNHMMVLSNQILKDKGLDAELLRPIIEETFRKSVQISPESAQTGPAVRNDTVIMERHLNMLKNKPLLQKIYTFTSESIQLQKSKKK